jgi:serine/threonine-protein kinase
MGRLSGLPPGPSDVFASVPPALDAIDRKALASEPGDRFASAAAFAESLDGFLASTATPAAPAAGAGPAIAVAPAAVGLGVGGASGATRPAVPAPTPAASRPYPADAYAGSVPAAPPADEPPRESTSPWVWASGLVGLLVIAIAGFLIFQLVSGGSSTPPVEQVTVPSLVGKTIDEARVTASSLGIELVTSPQQATDQPIGTILSQDPPADTKVDKGSQVTVTVATGTETVAVPDLRLKTETDALAAIFAAGLTNGTRSEAYDPIVPAGSIVSQDPQAGVQVARDTKVNYVVSRGPEPSPSESPSPTPTPVPTPAPSPSETPSPTPVPTPTPIVVGDYRCLTLDAAAQQMGTDGFVLGTVTTNPQGGSPDGSWQVQAQVPTPGESRPPGTSIRVTVISPTDPCP